MGFARNFTQTFQRWRKGRDQRASDDDPFGDEAEDSDGKDKDATDRFRRKRGVDYDAVFKEPASRSRAKHRSSGQYCDPLVVDMLLDFWATFFDSFREDEKDFELAKFRQEAGEVQAALDELGPDGAPDLVLARQMLYLLSRFSRQRYESWNLRFEDMLAQHRAHKAELEAVKLTSCWQTDEIAHCKDIIANTIRQRDMRVPTKPDGLPPTLNELLCAMLGIQAQPPRPQAHTSRMRRQSRAEEEQATAAGTPVEPDSGQQEALERQATAEAEAEGKLLAKVLGDMIAGRTTLAKLTRAVEDRDLARQLLEMSTEFHRNRGILARLGLLPNSAQGEADEGEG